MCQFLTILVGFSGERLVNDGNLREYETDSTLLIGSIAYEAKKFRFFYYVAPFGTPVAL